MARARAGAADPDGVRSSSLPTAARTVALVLAVLAVIAAVNALLVIAYAVDRGAGPGLAAVAIAGVLITGALGYGAVRLWRGAGPRV